MNIWHASTKVTRGVMPPKSKVISSVTTVYIDKETQSNYKDLPVCDWPYKRVGNQLHGGLGSKQHSYFDIFINQLVGGAGAVG